MKSILTLAALIFSLVAQANTTQSVFKADSPIPQDLKTLILEKLEQNCAAYLSPYGLSEMQTSVVAQKVDQGQIDYFFATAFESRMVQAEGNATTASLIFVRSADYAINNPVDARYQVLEIYVDGKTCR